MQSEMPQTATHETSKKENNCSKFNLYNTIFSTKQSRMVGRKDTPLANCGEKGNPKSLTFFNNLTT